MKIPVFSKKTKIMSAGILLAALALIPSVYFYTKYQALKEQVATPGSESVFEAKDLAAQIQRHMLLPETDETPTLMTVTNITELSEQPFFDRAQNGDKVLLYTQAKKAILYRPSQDLIIEVAPVNIATGSGTSADPSPTPDQDQSYTFVILNGTTVVGLTTRYQEELTSSIENSVVLDRDNAARSNYTESILVDLKGDKEEVASQIAASLDIAVSSLPDGEEAADADFLVILGSDAQ